MLRKILFVAAVVQTCSTAAVKVRSNGVLKFGGKKTHGRDLLGQLHEPVRRDVRREEAHGDDKPHVRHEEAVKLGDNPQFVTRLARRWSASTSASGSLLSLGKSITGHAMVTAAQLQQLRAAPVVEDSNELYIKTGLKSINMEFLGPMGIGTKYDPAGCNNRSSLLEVDIKRTCRTIPQQSLNVVFDTGSTNMWIASTLCQSGPCTAPGRKRYDMRESATYKVLPEVRTLDVRFGTGRLKGTQAVDDFHIGPFTLKNQTFAQIQEESGESFDEVPLEGIVGLGFPSLSTTTDRPFFDSLIDQKVLKRNMFAFYLPQEDGLDSIFWGGLDRHLYKGKILWFPVAQPYYWTLDLHGFLIGNQSMSVNGDDGDSGGALPKLIIDTGTTYYTAENRLHKQILAELPHQACSDAASLPDITYQLKDIDGVLQNLTVSQENYMISVAAQGCDAGFQRMNLPPQHGPGMILGQLFMRSYIAIFDRADGVPEKARVGFAEIRPPFEVFPL
jgi:pepsin A